MQDVSIAIDSAQLVAVLVAFVSTSVALARYIAKTHLKHIQARLDKQSGELKVLTADTSAKIAQLESEQHAIKAQVLVLDTRLASVCRDVEHTRLAVDKMHDKIDSSTQQIIALIESSRS